ncbi:hypothetical protein QYM36_018721 [Artemia franciscana]|uniref:Uncharacterized protein n=1 Tax=Artemia franciscana TaxID=6661 RepID=A0AA88KRD4_ARTSF|nr:hypothetical protein QYM36_018721 [Artemia franciscana]
MSPDLSITDLDYADDVDMLAWSVAESQAMISDVTDRKILTNIRISQYKTKNMQNDGKAETPGDPKR